MKNNRNLFIGTLTISLALLASCSNSPEETNPAELEQPQNNNATQNPSSSPINADSTTNTSTTSEAATANSENQNTPMDTQKNTTSVKADYLKKLNETKIAMDEKRKQSANSSTYELKYAEDTLYDIWDGLLNEIYGVLKEQLSPEEMAQLRDEQRKWIEYRDKTALEASYKYKGGTQEHVEYVVVRNNLTAERCFELVENYMK
ncbi:DUF1311 domain-containing protein [Lysinibacillus fusiformis]|nr:DUF1311 domain-containing protein [Lysinibacillus fusiformis]